MTTQQSEGGLLNEKPLERTIPMNKEGLNGNLEVNGHASPRRESPSSSPPKQDQNGEMRSASLDTPQNQDAFLPNDSITNEIKNADETATSARPDIQGESREEETAKHLEDVEEDAPKLRDMDARQETENETTPADTDMPDAPANQAPGEKVSEAASPKSEVKTEAADMGEEQELQPENAADAAGAPDDLAPRDEKEDVAMADAAPENEVSVVKGASEGTGANGLRDVSPVSPKGAVDDSRPNHTESADARLTASAINTELAQPIVSEPAEPSTKFSRERDIDSEDEPVAKRTKVDHATEGQTREKREADGESMAVDQPAANESGQAKNLSDDALNDSPITEWQNKQIRQVLAGVKKTKVGAIFRLPVAQLWPQLWAEYSAKVSNPVDISSMEKRLRGDGPRYETMGEFKQDLDLMVQNSVTFNGEAHDVTLQAKACREAILGRMALQPATEPAKPERKESAKAHSTRHVEPRAATAVSVAPEAVVGRPAKGGAASPSQTRNPVPESPAFALPPNSNGVPLIRRDSTKVDGRAKRPVKPAHPKDLVYDTKRKKKLPLELRFCDEVLTELRKSKHYDINAAFLQPVDPVALNIPTYHKVIKKPMDLSTMAEKLAGGDYTSLKEFEKDFDLIIKNCRLFNGEDHIVYGQARRLQDLYRAEMSKKDEWMARHAPAAPSRAAASPHLHDDSDSEEADSEADPEQDEERKLVQQRLVTLQKRLDQEQKKINEMLNSGTSQIADVEISQSVVALLQKNMMQERAKLANLPAKKPSKPKPSKSKKAGGAGGITGKKAAVAGAAPKKSGTKKTAKKKIGQLEKDIVTDAIGNLEGQLLERAIDIIKKDTGQGENDAGELELDIEVLSDEALQKLYDIAIKAFPNVRAEKERERYGNQAAPAAPEPAAAGARSGAKSKKNKPMSKSEQERRIQQLNELRAQAARQGSGSQEPLESIEGNGHEAINQPEQDSEDEVDSEED
ncbi:uncharacterized protein B0T15DRAFT_400428 [Chaetomium strumarium]|uniref:Bromodomain-containing protein n=1 Tax=Chaetomium strumarium TaxID=1170767 RepID=A0AAJ0GRV2_9PEZI|nr:hypothetical protein B0T15DRAFT_400428 [Chaetomium strumarium]